MKHWQETRQILRRVVELGRADRACAVATVTRIQGSAYRRAGAKLLIEADGKVLGGVSGGCLEEDVRQVGLEMLGTGASRLLHYATGDDESRIWGLGLGCNGEVDILVQAISPESACGPWAEVQKLLDADSPFTLSIHLEPEGAGTVLAVGEQGRLAGGLGDSDADAEVEAVAAAWIRARRPTPELPSRRTFTEVLFPPPGLLVCGAGEDARPLAALGAAAGFRVSVADPRTAYLTPERFPEAWMLLPLHPDEESAELDCDATTYAVVMNHSLDRDKKWVRRLLSTAVPYIGVLGPRARTLKILEELGASGDARVFGPVGLDLGADGPEQVGLSIVAEILSVRARREPRHLRLREVAVHADS